MTLKTVNSIQDDIMIILMRITYRIACRDTYNCCSFHVNLGNQSQRVVESYREHFPQPREQQL